MTTTHTPGPWTVESDDGVDFTVLGGKSSQVRIAVECGERDARLIAAAPDMLAALYEIANYDPTKWDAATLGNIARSAIARATA